MSRRLRARAEGGLHVAVVLRSERVGIGFHQVSRLCSFRAIWHVVGTPRGKRSVCFFFRGKVPEVYACSTYLTACFPATVVPIYTSVFGCTSAVGGILLICGAGAWPQVIALVVQWVVVFVVYPWITLVKVKYYTVQIYRAFVVPAVHYVAFGVEVPRPYCGNTGEISVINDGVRDYVSVLVSQRDVLHGADYV